MVVSTVETNRDRERPCRDKLFFGVQIFSTVETNFFLFSWSRFLKLRFFNQNFSIKIYLRRDIYQDRQDKSRMSRFLRFGKTFQDLLRYLDIIETF
jgi:hypothetical protein